MPLLPSPHRGRKRKLTTHDSSHNDLQLRPDDPLPLLKARVLQRVEEAREESFLIYDRTARAVVCGKAGKRTIPCSAVWPAIDTEGIDSLGLLSCQSYRAVLKEAAAAWGLEYEAALPTCPEGPMPTPRLCGLCGSEWSLSAFELRKAVRRDHRCPPLCGFGSSFGRTSRD